jgi:hypothetical protein
MGEDFPGRIGRYVNREDQIQRALRLVFADANGRDIDRGHSDFSDPRDKAHQLWDGTAGLQPEDSGIVDIGF